MVGCSRLSPWGRASGGFAAASVGRRKAKPLRRPSPWGSVVVACVAWVLVGCFLFFLCLGCRCDVSRAAVLGGVHHQRRRPRAVAADVGRHLWARPYCCAVGAGFRVPRGRRLPPPSPGGIRPLAARLSLCCGLALCVLRRARLSCRGGFFPRAGPVPLLSSSLVLA